MINNLNFNINTLCSPMVETNNGIVLRGQYYTKEYLSPISFSGCQFNNLITGTNTLNIMGSCYLDTSIRQGFRHQQFGVVSDPYINNRYYCSINNHHALNNNGVNYLVQTTEQQNDLSIRAINTSPQYNIYYKIIDIDDNYIYVIAKNISSIGSTFVRINKKNNTIDSPIYLNPNARTVFSKIYSDARYIYFCCRKDNISWQFYRYDKTTSTYTGKGVSVVNNNNSPANQCFIYENIYQEGNICYIYQMFQDKTNNHSIIGIKIDITKDVTDSSNLQFFYPMDYNSNIKINVHNNYELHRFWIIDKYLYYIIYDEDYISGYNNSIPAQGLYTFEILPNGNLKYISCNRMDTDEQVISMVFSSDKRALIIGFWKSFILMRYNDITKQYDVASTEHYTNVSTVGFDEYNRLWVMHTDKSVHMYSINDPKETTIRFQQPMYAHAGTDIYSYVEFSAITFIGEYAKGMYRFELSGPAYFTDNNKRTIDIEYVGELQNIPITITGSDQLSCKVYYIKGGD